MIDQRNVAKDTDIGVQTAVFDFSGMTATADREILVATEPGDQIEILEVGGHTTGMGGATSLKWGAYYVAAIGAVDGVAPEQTAKGALAFETTTVAAAGRRRKTGSTRFTPGLMTGSTAANGYDPLKTGSFVKVRCTQAGAGTPTRVQGYVRYRVLRGRETARPTAL
jgi:hypothetical protein